MRGLNHIIRILDKIDERQNQEYSEETENKSMWIAYEYGKRTLSERLYRIKL